MLNVIFLAKPKPSALLALQWLRLQKNLRIVAIVLPESYEIEEQVLEDLPRYTPLALYQAIEVGEIPETDLVLSFLFWEKIPQLLIDFPKQACLNFHPAPLPDYRGLGGYNFAIFEELEYWGVSAHHVNAQFDKGDLVEVRRFPIDSEDLTAYRLESITQKMLYALFTEIISRVLRGENLPKIPQGKGRYINRLDMENLKKIDLERDSKADILRKIRACWFPPYDGAYIEHEGERFTLVSEAVLQEIAEIYQRKYE